MTCNVQFEPSGISVPCEAGTSILDAARLAGVPMTAICGGRGTCGKCQVRIVSGTAPAAEPTEERTLSAAALAAGYRLACLHPVHEDLVIESLPITSHGKREAPGEERPFDLTPVVRRHALQLTPPSVTQPIDDASNLLKALQAKAGVRCTGFDVRVLQSLPDTLRGARWNVLVSEREEEIVAVRSGDVQSPCLGIAVDLGTTNIAAYLYDLTDGRQITAVGAANPLASYGADILSRLSYAQRQPGHGARLQQILVKALDLLVSYTTEAHGYRPADVDEMVVVGNSGMHHLFLNFNARQSA